APGGAGALALAGESALAALRSGRPGVAADPGEGSEQLPPGPRPPLCAARPGERPAPGHRAAAPQPDAAGDLLHLLPPRLSRGPVALRRAWVGPDQWRREAGHRRRVLAPGRS